MNELELNIYLDAIVSAAESKGALQEIHELSDAMGFDRRRRRFRHDAVDDDSVRRLALIAGCDASIETMRAFIIKKVTAVTP